MASPTEIGSDVVAAGAAVAGLMLVYMGALSNEYGSYDATQQDSVRGRFRWRMWFAFVGLLPNAISIPFGLAAKALENACALWAALILLAVGLTWLVAVAVMTALEIN
jgi:sterol desaturase/sphingolipid hydroxylase (fatty acid hydroxylase superfamily)